MKPLLYSLSPATALAASLRDVLEAEEGRLERRRFPDGETYLRFETSPEDRTVLLLESLADPDPRALPLLLAAEGLRKHGARRVVLVAPYLAYLRQDRSFRPGEAVTARSFARILSRSFDGVVTVDPHLHRIHSLREVYDVPCRVAHAAPLMGAWIREHVDRPLVVGPDEESRQWAEQIAEASDSPCRVLSKTRRGDRDVEIRLPDLGTHRDRSVVLVDDILSSGRTLATAARELQEAGWPPPAVVVVHAIFAEGAAEALESAHVERVVTCNTVPHPTNAIDVTEPLAAAVRDLLDASPGP